MKPTERQIRDEFLDRFQCISGLDICELSPSSQRVVNALITISTEQSFYFNERINELIREGALKNDPENE